MNVLLLILSDLSNNIIRRLGTLQPNGNKINDENIDYVGKNSECNKSFIRFIESNPINNLLNQPKQNTLMATCKSRMKINR